MSDETEGIRRILVEKVNIEPGNREALEIKYGKVWDTEELSKNFTVEGFMAPFVGVIEKETGKKGVLTFQHHPRFYFDFVEA